MDVNERMIGENIRAIRTAAKASLEDVAKRGGITKSTLSKIETGQISSPIGTLLSIAEALGVKLADFLHEPITPPHFVLTPKGKGSVIVRNGSHLGYSYEALAVNYPDKPVEPFILTVSPGDKEGHFFHPGQEFIYMISGEIEFSLGLEKIPLSEGDSLYFDPSLKHSIKLVSKSAARFLCIFIQPPNKAPSKA